MNTDYAAISSETDQKSHYLHQNAISVSVDDISYQPITPDNAPTCLSWAELLVSTKESKGKAQKKLLNKINGAITGGLWAIMVLASFYLYELRKNVIFG